MATPPSFPDRATRRTSRGSRVHGPLLQEEGRQHILQATAQTLEAELAVIAFGIQAASWSTSQCLLLPELGCQYTEPQESCCADCKRGGPPLPQSPRPGRHTNAPPRPGLQSQPYRSLALLIQAELAYRSQRWDGNGDDAHFPSIGKVPHSQQPHPLTSPTGSSTAFFPRRGVGGWKETRGLTVESRKDVKIHAKQGSCLSDHLTSPLSAQPHLLATRATPV